MRRRSPRESAGRANRCRAATRTGVTIVKRVMAPLTILKLSVQLDQRRLIMPAAKTPKAKTASKTAATAKVARAPVTVSKPGTSKPEPQPAAPPALSAQEREKLIAHAAYFRAEKRGFAPGYELQDWAEAEAEVKRLIGRA